MHQELERILAIDPPKRYTVDETPLYVRSEHVDDASLRPLQSECLHQMKEAGGLLGCIGVGLGKTLISFLAPAALGSKKPVLMVPASVYPQTIKMYAEAKCVWEIPELAIIPYSLLSSPEGTKLLDRIKPDLIICDEAHSIKRAEAARTKRVIRYYRENPETMFVALSGTMTNRSLLDYAHLAELALREKSPLPRDKYVLESWSRVIDADGIPLRQDWGTVKPLLKVEPIKMKKDIVRDAYRERFRATPGVVCSSDADVNASLQINFRRHLPWPVKEYNKVLETGMRPDGQLFEDDVAEWRCLRQVSLGFFYKWDWGDRKPNEEWVEARNGWSRHVRHELKARSRAGYDSPLLVRNTLVPEDGSVLARAWRRWEAVKSTDPGPDTVPVWMTDLILETVLASISTPTLLWYDSVAVADKLDELGVNVYRAGEQPPEYEVTSAVSMGSHGIGWNMQHFSRNLVLEPPSSGQVWEQVIGRTHRTGQEEDTVIVEVLQHTKVFKDALLKAIKDAEYIEATTGNRQRLSFADYVL